jgi:hypothetical protein
MLELKKNNTSNFFLMVLLQGFLFCFFYLQLSFCEDNEQLKNFETQIPKPIPDITLLIAARFCTQGEFPKIEWCKILYPRGGGFEDGASEEYRIL